MLERANELYVRQVRERICYTLPGGWKDEVHWSYRIGDTWTDEEKVIIEAVIRECVKPDYKNGWEFVKWPGDTRIHMGHSRFWLWANDATDAADKIRAHYQRLYAK